MTPRRQPPPLLVDDRAMERISRREPLGDAGGDPVLRLLEALARDADGRRRTPHRASSGADVLEFRRPSAAGARPDRVVGWRSSVGGLVTLAAVVVGSGGVAAALTGSPFAAITGLRGVLAQAAGDEVPSRDGARSGVADVPRRADADDAVRGHRRHDPGGAVAGVPPTVPTPVASRPVSQESLVLLPARPATPAADAPSRSQDPAPVSLSEPRPESHPQPQPTRSPEPPADGGADSATAAASERGHREGGDSDDRAADPRTGEARLEKPPPSDSSSPEPRTSESRHVEAGAHEPRHVNAPAEEPAAPVVPEQASS